MARTYKRDGNGRFAGGGGSSGGGGGKRPAAKSVSRGVNRLTRDNAGKITSVGGEGATARGGRLKTAAGNKRAMQTAKVSGGRPAGTMKGKIKRDPGAAGKIGQQAKPAAAPSKKPTSKAGTATSDIAARRARANAPKASMYLSPKLNTQSAITRSAANAIYNEQRSTLRMQKSKQASPDVIKIGLIGRGLSGSKRDRAMANREAARKRVVGGRRR